MKYEEDPGPENAQRFESLLKRVLSTSNAVVRQRLAEEKRIKKKKAKAKTSSARASGDKD